MSGLVDWGQVGAAITAVGIGAGGVYAWWLKTTKSKAVTSADIATARAEESVADANSKVYKMLLERVITLENDMRIVRDELAQERQHSRRLVLHIWKLEGLMRAAGLDAPPFVDGEGPIAVQIVAAAKP